MRFTRPLLSLSLALSLATGCASTAQAPTEARITDEISLEASVLEVDRTTRMLTVEREDGSQVKIFAGPEIQNFDRIESGDTIRARYILAIGARLLDSQEAGTPTMAGVGAGRAEPGELPAAAFGTSMVMTVTINRVDKDTHEVTFTGPDGMLQTIQAERLEGQRFVSGLEPGDRVELSFAEAVALSVEE